MLKKLVVVGLLTTATPAAASTFTIHVGPPSLGTGGSNPLSIPPVNLYEYELEYVTQNDWEANLGLVPGAFFGKRSRSQTGGGGTYMSFGGGLAVDANGYGPGIYSSLGYDWGKPISFNIEVKQALGYSVSNNNVISPYAIRMGAAFNF